MSPSLANLQVFITSCGGSTSITVTTSILQGLHEQEKTLLHEWRKKTYRHGKDLMKGMRFRHSKAWYFTVTVQHQTLRPDNNLMRTQDFQGRARSAKLMGTFWLPPIPTASFFFRNDYSYCILAQQLVPNYLILHCSYHLPLFLLCCAYCIN